MKYTCPKCGKTIELSTEALIASDYYTVCPQCLTRLQIVGNYAYVPLADGSLELSAEPPNSQQQIASDKQPPVLPPALPREEQNAPVVTQSNPAAVDPLFGEAVRFLSHCNAITPVMLRDHFGITLERAQTLITQLEQAGVVGPYQGGAPRTILIPHRNELPGPFRVTAIDDEQQNNNESKTNPDNKTYTFTCSGCLSFFIIAAFIIFMFKACT